MKRLKSNISHLKIKGLTLTGTVTDEQYKEAIAASPTFAEYFEDVPEATEKEKSETKKVK